MSVIAWFQQLCNSKGHFPKCPSDIPPTNIFLGKLNLVGTERWSMRILGLLGILLGCVIGVFAANEPGPQPFITLDLSSLSPSGQAEREWTTVSFVSETSIAIGLCPQGQLERCPLYLVRWQDGVLRPFAQTTTFAAGATIHPATEGRLLTTSTRHGPVLYSSDLSESLNLPVVSRISQSGSTFGETIKQGWKIYRLSPKPELLRQGTGSLESISDDAIVYRDHDVLRAETLDGKSLGSFSVKPESKCGTETTILSRDRLYLDLCKHAPIVVDFSGKQLRKLDPPRGCCGYDNSWSDDGRRLLFDYTSRDVSPFRTFGQVALAVGTLGAGVADQLDNRQNVKVLDTVSGASCFEWHRQFAMGSELKFRKTAAISPSGELVAVAAEKNLFVYHLPAVCATSR